MEKTCRKGNKNNISTTQTCFVLAPDMRRSVVTIPGCKTDQARKLINKMLV